MSETGMRVAPRGQCEWHLRRRQVNAWLEKDEYATLKMLAEEQDQSLSECVRQIVCERLSND